MDETQFEYVKELCKPIREYLAINHNLHTAFIITMDNIKVVSDELNIPVIDELLD